MPDIVSRIKVEAQGADQAAREIRKLKEAYEQVSLAAKGISPAGVGGADPFQQAISAGAAAGGVVGQSSADVAARETRNRQFADAAQRREQANSNYNRGLAGNVNGAFSSAQAFQSGQLGQVGGNALQGLGGLVGGAAGMTMIAGAAALYGLNKLAQNSQERIGQYWGSGISQRMGASYEDVSTGAVAYGRAGINAQTINSFFSSASSRGFTYNRGSQGAVNQMMEVMASMGIDPGTMGSFAGALSQTGNIGMGSSYNLYGMGKNAFGQAGMGQFVAAITQGFENAMQRGIEVTPEAAARQANMMAAYGNFGGLSVAGAASLNQMATGRAQSAAGLNSPEDLIAFQAMRSQGMSVTDTLLSMEHNPNQTNRSVYEYIKQSTGGDRDLMRMRLRSYMPDASMSQIEAFIASMEGTAGMNMGEIAAGGAMGVASFSSEGYARQATAVENNRALFGVEEEVNRLKTDLMSALLGVDPSELSSYGIQFGTGKRSILSEEGFAETTQNIENAKVWVQGNPEFNFIASSGAMMSDLESSLQLRENPGLMAPWVAMTSETTQQGWNNFYATGEQAWGGGGGGWSGVVGNIINGINAEISNDLGRSGRDATIALNALKTSENITYETMMEILSRITTILDNNNIVFTDGNYSQGSSVPVNVGNTGMIQ
jgi:hypothetical protein